MSSALRHALMQILDVLDHGELTPLVVVVGMLAIIGRAFTNDSQR